MKALLLVATFFIQTVGQLPNQMGVVTGRLTKNGQPAANVRVSAMVIPEAGVSISEVSALASVALTDSDGRYRLENVPPGRYYVTAGFLDVPTYYPGVAPIGSAKAVNVEAGSTTAGIDFTTAVSTGTTVSGRVIYPPGQPVPANLRVSLAGTQRPFPESFVQPDGSFEVPRVRPGNYTLRVSPTSWTATVIVGDSDLSGVDIEVPYNVAGSVTVENGGLLPNLSLKLASAKPGAEPQSIALSTAGAFSSQVTPGDYRLAVSGLPPGYSLKAVTSGSVDLVANPLKVVAGTPPSPISVVLGVTSPAPWVKVSGKVGGAGFLSGPRYPFTLAGKGLVAPIQSLLTAEGSFELPRVLPGDYTLRVTATTVRSAEIHVGNVDLSGVEIAIPPTKEVNARITIEGQQQGGFAAAAAAAQIFVSTNTAGAGNGTAIWLTSGTPSSFELALTDDSGTTVTTVTRQGDGTFRMRLPEGERTVKAEVSGYTVKSLSYGSIDLLKDSRLKVSSADTAQVEMTLVPPAPGTALTSSLSNTLSSIVRVYVSNVGTAAGGVAYSLSSFSEGSAASPNTAVHIGQDIAQANLLSSVPPAYPTAASGVKDSVVLRADIDKAGTVTNVFVVRGHPLLNDAAIAAVKQWRYRPQVLNGQPVAVVTTIRIDK